MHFSFEFKIFFWATIKSIMEKNDPLMRMWFPERYHCFTMVNFKKLWVELKRRRTFRDTPTQIIDGEAITMAALKSGEGDKFGF